MSDVVLSDLMRTTILTLQRTERLIDRTTERLATGLKVNSALDNPEAFFAARGLRNEASDYSRVIDGIGQSARAIEQALIGVESINSLLNLGGSIVDESRLKLETGQIDQAIFIDEIDSSPPPLRSQILQSAPSVYLPLDDAGPTADDLGTGGGVTATYTGGVATGAPPLYTNGGTGSASFDGGTGRVAVQDSGLINVGARAAHSVELVFNANDVTSRQVLFEAGGGTNSFNIYVFNGRVHITGRDNGNWGPSTPGGPTNMSFPIVVGETYHVAFVFSQGQDRFEGYVNGVSVAPPISVGGQPFPSHNGNIGIGAMEQDVWFDDISAAGSGFRFDGQISDVAIYNRELTDPEILSHATSLEATTTELFKHRDFENVMDQIDQITEDARYREANLLQGGDLRTNFNPERTSFLDTQGTDLRTSALGIPRHDFNDLEDLDVITEQIRKALDIVRGIGRSLTNDILVIQTREGFTEGKINHLETGADKLTLADMNEEAANQLALQTRQALAGQSLTLAAQTERAVLTLF